MHGEKGDNFHPLIRDREKVGVAIGEWEQYIGARIHLGLVSSRCCIIIIP